MASASASQPVDEVIRMLKEADLEHRHLDLSSKQKDEIMMLLIEKLEGAERARNRAGRDDRWKVKLLQLQTLCKQKVKDAKRIEQELRGRVEEDYANCLKECVDLKAEVTGKEERIKKLEQELEEMRRNLEELRKKLEVAEKRADAGLEEEEIIFQVMRRRPGGTAVIMKQYQVPRLTRAEGTVTEEENAVEVNGGEQKGNAEENMDSTEEEGSGSDQSETPQNSQTEEESSEDPGTGDTSMETEGNAGQESQEGIPEENNTENAEGLEELKDDTVEDANVITPPVEREGGEVTPPEVPENASEPQDSGTPRRNPARECKSAPNDQVNMKRKVEERLEEMEVTAQKTRRITNMIKIAKQSSRRSQQPRRRSEPVRHPLSPPEVIDLVESEEEEPDTRLTLGTVSNFCRFLNSQPRPFQFPSKPCDPSLLESSDSEAE